MSQTDLLEAAGLTQERAAQIVAEATAGADDGELYLEYTQSEGLSWDNGRLKGASFDTNQGFGLRAIAGEAAGYAHSGELSEAALKRASDAVRAVTKGYSGTYADAPGGTNAKLYRDDSPLNAPSFEDKVKLLSAIDGYTRDRDDRVRQVSVSMGSSWQCVDIIRADGHRVRDVRPMVRFGVSVVMGEGERQESGSYSFGGRDLFDAYLTDESWQNAVHEAMRQADVNLTATASPAGELDVVLGPGWPGILLHEAVGHGLEGDFNRKKTSAFAGLMGERVAAPGVTVVDDGTLSGRRGSITIDDEGSPSEYTTLIEDGVLVGYMQDRQNARLMGMKPTGNGRRQSYAHIPMPRMTNTYMLNGQHEPDEIMASVKSGLFAKSFGGGQVDITSGKFVFSCTEAYLIENGKLGAPVKGAMIIGNGPDAMHRVSMIGNDMALDNGSGNCGKAGQWVPVGVGQPSMRINALTVGGTAV